MLHVPLLLGRTDLNATEGPSHRSQCLRSQRISASYHIHSSHPLLTFSTCLSLLIEEHFPYPQLKSCVWFCTHQQGHTKHGEFCLCVEGCQGRNEHVCTCVCADHEQCPVLHGKGEEEITVLLSYQHMLCHVHAALAPAASRHSHQCSTILKNCFGFVAGAVYWGEISHRPLREKDSDHSPQKGFLLLSQLPCTSGLSSLAPENSFLFSGVPQASALLPFAWSCTWQC